MPVYTKSRKLILNTTGHNNEHMVHLLLEKVARNPSFNSGHLVYCGF